MPPQNDEIPDSPQARVDSARGYKAALHNPRVSDENKEHAAEMLDKLDDKGSQEEIYRRDEKPKSQNRVVAGLKASLHNPLVGDEGRREAAEKLQELGYENPGE